MLRRRQQATLPDPVTVTVSRETSPTPDDAMLSVPSLIKMQSTPDRLPVAAAPSPSPLLSSYSSPTHDAKRQNEKRSHGGHFLGLQGRGPSRLDPDISECVSDTSSPASPRSQCNGHEAISQSAVSLADFAIAEPTPHTELEDTQSLSADLPLRYGAIIRLNVGDSSPIGCLGYVARDLRRIKGELPQGGRLNVGMGDTFYVCPPFRANQGWHWKEAFFKVEHQTKGQKEGEMVRYGQEVLLVDEEDAVMCHFRGRKYIRRKPRGTRGEMTLALIPVDERKLGQPVSYGDTDIRLRLTTRRGLRSKDAIFLSALKREGMDAIGGFLNCLGHGKECRFGIEHAPPLINGVCFTTTLAYGRRVFVNRVQHHHLHWGEQLSFITLSPQAHHSRSQEGCTIRISLSNGARLKLQQEHLQTAEPGRSKEMWLPTRGMSGMNLDLLLRLVHTDTVNLDPNRHYIPTAELKVKNHFPRLSIPIPYLVIVFVIGLLWDYEPSLVQHLQHAKKLAGSLLLAYPVYWACNVLAEWLYGLLPKFSKALSWAVLEGSEPELPVSMCFDRWQLGVLGWKLAGEDEAPPAPLPPTFVEAEGGDVSKAQARWERTQQWRRENEVDLILQKPHPKFHIIKKYYPQAFHYRDKQGHVCFYEVLGKLNVEALTGAGVDTAVLTRHVILHQEFLWQILQPRQEDRVIIIMDLKGVCMADVTGEVINFAKTTVGLTSAHYPARSHKMIILHVPGWFNLIFRFIKPMLNEAMKKKIVFMGDGEVEEGGLLQYIDASYLPKEYGGQCEVPLGQSPFEKQLLDLVDSALEEHEMDMAEA